MCLPTDKMFKNSSILIRYDPETKEPEAFGQKPANLDVRRCPLSAFLPPAAPDECTALPCV